MPHRIERHTFLGSLGAALSARLVRPVGRPRMWALIAHGFTSSKDLASISRISRTLAGRSIAALSFDFTGLGQSEGDFAATTFSTNVDDIRRATDFMRRELRPPALLIGLSLGGAAMIAAAAHIPEARGVVTIGAPDDTRHLRNLLLHLAPELLEREEAMVEIAERPVRIRRALLDDLGARGFRRHIEALRVALLVLHAPEDDIVPLTRGLRLFEKAPEPKTFVSLDGMDHLLLRDPADAVHVGNLIADWAKDHMET